MNLLYDIIAYQTHTDNTVISVIHRCNVGATQGKCGHLSKLILCLIFRSVFNKNGI